ncbi:UTP--glucose-1-phosphate uridylyltransferase, partial [Shouchella clausii]
QTKDSTPCLLQLIQVFNKYQQAVVGVQKVSLEDVSKYGIVRYASEPIADSIYNILDLIEKPTVDKAPSN